MARSARNYGEPEIEISNTPAAVTVVAPPCAPCASLVSVEDKPMARSAGAGAAQLTGTLHFSLEDKSMAKSAGALATSRLDDKSMARSAGGRRDLRRRDTRSRQSGARTLDASFAPGRPRSARITALKPFTRAAARRRFLVGKRRFWRPRGQLGAAPLRGRLRPFSRPRGARAGRAQVAAQGRSRGGERQPSRAVQPGVGSGQNGWVGYGRESNDQRGATRFLDEECASSSCRGSARSGASARPRGASSTTAATPLFTTADNSMALSVSGKRCGEWQCVTMNHGTTNHAVARSGGGL